MDKGFKIAVMLSAYDKMSTVVNSAVDKASAKLKALQKTSEKINKAGNNMMIAGGIGTGAFAYAIKQAADQEKMQIALTTAFQGNKKAAEAAFGTINKFAAKTPYEMGEVMTAFIKLKNMGLDPSEKALTAYGNTASGMGKDLSQMIEAVADAATFEFERLKEFGIRATKNGEKVTFLFQGVKTTVKKNSKEIEKYLQNIGLKKFGGGIEAQSKSINGQLSTLKDNFNMSAAAIGKMFVPMLNRMFAKIGPIITKMQAWIEKHPQLIKILAAVSVAFLGLGAAAKVIAFGMNGLSPALKVLSFSFKFLGNTIGFVGKIFLTNPILLIIAAIAAAAYLIYKNWGAIKAWFQRLWDNVKAIFSAVWDWIKRLFMKYTPAGLIIKHWSKISAFFSNLWQGVKNVFSSVWDWIKGLFLKYTPMGIIYKHWDEIVAYFTKLWDKIKNIFKNAWASIKSGLKSFFSNGNSDAEAALEKYKATLTKTVNVGITNKPGIVNNTGTFGAAALQPAPVNNKSINTFAPVINYSGPGGPAAAQQMGVDVVKQMKAYDEQQKRVKF